MYKEQKQRLTTILNLLGECLKDENFTSEEKAKIFQMVSELLAMFMAL